MKDKILDLDVKIEAKKEANQYLDKLIDENFSDVSDTDFANEFDNPIPSSNIQFEDLNVKDELKKYGLDLDAFPDIN